MTASESGNHVLAVLDFICAALAILLVLALACACRLNMLESPVNGIPRGSSYTADAIGNPHWVAAHPRLAAFIRAATAVEALEVPVFLFCLPLFLARTAIPAVCILYLCWRTWHVRRGPVHAFALLCILAVIAATLPALDGALTVLAD